MIQNILPLCGVAMAGVAATLLLKEAARPYALFCTVFAAVIILTSTVTGGLRPIVNGLFGFGTDYLPTEYCETLQKALGIAYIISITEQICRQAGEVLLAESVELLGKAELLLLALPLLGTLLDRAREVLQL